MDALAVHKDPNGDIEVAHLSNIPDEEAVELGSKLAALIGLGIEGEDGFDHETRAGAEAAAATDATDPDNGVANAVAEARPPAS